MNSRWLSVHEIADHIGVSRDTIYRWIDEKKIPAHKIGRLWKFNMEEVDTWVHAGKGADDAPTGGNPGHTPVFMATSEQGGKDTSGDYSYRFEANGDLIEDDNGNPLVNQDCVKYRDEDPDGIAETFVAWAGKHRMPFWADA